MLRAAVQYQRQGLGQAVVIGRDFEVKADLEALGLGDAIGEIEVMNAAKTEHLDRYEEFLYNRLQRKGFDSQDIHRLAARDRMCLPRLWLPTVTATVW